MTALKDMIITGIQPGPRRTLLYGTPGIGKSTFASQADAPIIIQTEDGLRDIDCPKLPLAKTFNDVENQLTMLCEQEHQFKTLVIDSLDWLETMIWSAVARDHDKKNIEDIGYGKGFRFAMDRWETVLHMINYLQSQKGMEIILVAHAQIEKFVDPEGETYDRYSPRLHKLSCARVSEWCDEVLFAHRKVMTVEKDDLGFGKKRVVALKTADRFLRTVDGPSAVAKSRITLPVELPLSYAAYRAAREESTSQNVSASNKPNPKKEMIT